MEKDRETGRISILSVYFFRIVLFCMLLVLLNKMGLLINILPQNVVIMAFFYLVIMYLTLIYTNAVKKMNDKKPSLRVALLALLGLWAIFTAIPSAVAVGVLLSNGASITNSGYLILLVFQAILSKGESVM